MFKPPHFKGADDSFWLTSDSHFNHKSFVWGPRGYSSAEEHDEDLIKKWNEVVKITDTVFFLGDFILSVNKAESALQYLRRLNFKYLIMLWGNHNAGLKQLYQEEIAKQYNLKSEQEIYPLIVKLGDKEIIFVGHYFECFINGQHVVMSHFPLRTWHKNGKGSLCATGHSHGNDEGINPDARSSKILDVGVDNFGMPISFREFKNIMKEKNICVSDHHGTDPIEI